MRPRHRASLGFTLGFTLIELVATITIMAIIAAVGLPRLTVATPFLERGYADTLAASLRQARAVAIASSCDVQFTVNALGYSALQRAPGASNDCAKAGGFVTAVRRGDGDVLTANMPAGVALAANRQFTFINDGSVPGGPYNIAVGPHALIVEASGLVH
jgi:prepilin-type N-terminal cleavage/methylation domain-containing protein